MTGEVTLGIGNYGVLENHIISSKSHAFLLHLEICDFWVFQIYTYLPPSFWNRQESYQMHFFKNAKCGENQQPSSCVIKITQIVRNIRRTNMVKDPVSFLKLACPSHWMLSETKTPSFPVMALEK